LSRFTAVPSRLCAGILGAVLARKQIANLVIRNLCEIVVRLPDGENGSGQSGNPGGRPKGYGDLRELARQHTEDAIATLVAICRNGENESARVAAANAILDRGWGKPAVPVVACDPPAVITLDFGWREKPRAPAPPPTGLANIDHPQTNCLVPNPAQYPDKI
jgi:hypothetical protein